MKQLTKHIPNAITSLNLLCGVIACIYAVHNQYFEATIYLLVAAVFDFADGFAARLLKAYSPMGKQLDSLADMISFGVAPGIILYAFLNEISSCIFAIPAFLIPMFSALRLAKFNIDERQTNSFLGLPTPADAMFWVVGVMVIAKNFPLAPTQEQVTITLAIAYILIVFFVYLMVSEIPMFALKFKNFGIKNNVIRYLFLLISLALIILVQWSAIPAIVLVYIFMSIIQNTISKLSKPSN